MNRYIKPQIKNVHGVLFLEHKIRIGDGLGYAVEIDNPDGKYSSFIKMLNGKYTYEQILDKSLLSREEVDEGLQALNDYGYLEESEDQTNDLLSDSAKSKYKVNLNFLSTLNEDSKYSSQKKLMNSHVLILGLGGIGSNVCMALCELGIGKITAVDFDRVDPSNLNRQLLYDENDIGRLKTAVAREKIEKFNSMVDLQTIDKQIFSYEDIENILSQDSYDAVVNMADYPTGYIDSWVNRACVKFNIPLFAAVVNKKWGRVYSVIPHKTACYNCQCLEEASTNSDYLDELAAIKNTKGQDTELYRNPNGALGPACLFQGYFISYELLRLILFGEESLITYNKRFNINFMDFEQEFDELKKYSTCEVCGGK